jgi:ferritin-like metal-binding protein YciE
MPTKNQTKKQETEHTLEDLLIVQLRGLYDVETQLAKTLPRIIKKGTNVALKDALEHERAQTEIHKKRLEDIFEVLHAKAQKLPSGTIRGLIEDVDWITKNILGTAAIDVGLAGAFQAVQHYKIALYGTAFEWAKLLEFQEVIDILEETMHDTDEGLELLDELAGSTLNEAALGGDEEDSASDEDNDGEEDEEEDNNDKEDED